MGVLNIAVIGSDDLAKSIAKAADQRDIQRETTKLTALNPDSGDPKSSI